MPEHLDQDLLRPLSVSIIAFASIAVLALLPVPFLALFSVAQQTGDQRVFLTIVCSFLSLTLLNAAAAFFIRLRRHWGVVVAMVVASLQIMIALVLGAVCLNNGADPEITVVLAGTWIGIQCWLLN